MTDEGNGSSKFFATAQTEDEWPLIIASKFNIPYLLHKKGFGKVIIYLFYDIFLIVSFFWNFLQKVYGEVYSVDDLMLSKMDELECHPSYYTRVQTLVILEDGSKLNPWIYFIMDYKPELLKLNTYDNYSSYGEHGLPYVERSERNQTIDGTDEKYDVFSDIKLFL